MTRLFFRWPARYKCGTRPKNKRELERAGETQRREEGREERRGQRGQGFRGIQATIVPPAIPFSALGLCGAMSHMLAQRVLVLARR